MTARKPKTTTEAKAAPLSLDVAYDPGNRTLQLWDGSKLVTMPSKFLKLIGGRRPKVIGPNSTLLTVRKDPRSRFTDETYLVGEDCKRYSDTKYVMDGNKLENAGLYLLALIAQSYLPPALGGPRVTQDNPGNAQGAPAISINLKVAVNLTEGDVPVYAEEMTKSLKGQFKFEVGDQEVNLKVTKVVVYEEGIGPWRLYNHIKPQANDVYRGVINLGGSTLDGILIDSSGLVIEDSAFRSQTGGTTDLATRIKDVAIYSDPSLSGVNISVFMDNIANGQFEFNGTNFKGIYDEVFPEWFNGAVSQIQRRWSQHYHLIEAIIFTGGSSHLVAERIQGNPKFYLTPEPEADNVKGLLS